MPFHKSPQTSIVDVRPMGEPPPGREVEGLLPPRASRHLGTESEMRPALVLFHCFDEALGKCGTEAKNSRGLSNNFEVRSSLSGWSRMWSRTSDKVHIKIAAIEVQGKSIGSGESDVLRRWFARCDNCGKL